MRCTLAHCGEHRQDRNNIGAVRCVYNRRLCCTVLYRHAVCILRQRRTHALHNLHYSLIALQRSEINTAGRHALAQAASHSPEGGLRPVALHFAVLRLEALLAGYKIAAVRSALVLHLDAIFCQAVQRHIDIGRGLQRRSNNNLRIALQQRQREQQTADELAAHISRQLIFARHQQAVDRQGQLAIIVEILHKLLI